MQPLYPHVTMAAHNDTSEWAALVESQMGSDLKSLNLYEASMTPGGRVTGFRAVVKGSAKVNRNLGLNNIGATTALFPLAPVQGTELLTDSSFKGLVDLIGASVPDDSDASYGAHLLSSSLSVNDQEATPTLGSIGQVAIVSKNIMTPEGEDGTEYSVRVTVVSDRLTQQADAHHTYAVIHGRTYNQLLTEENEEYDGTTSKQVFGSEASGFPLSQAIVCQAAVKAAEMVGDSLGFTYKKHKFNNVYMRDRPRASLSQTTNTIRRLPNGDIEILSGVIPVKGSFVYDFGGSASSVFVEKSDLDYVSVSAPLPSSSSYEIDYGNRSDVSKKRIQSTWTWEGQADNIGTPLLNTSISNYSEALKTREAKWGGKVVFLTNKIGKAATHDPRDQPLTASDLL